MKRISFAAAMVMATTMGSTIPAEAHESGRAEIKILSYNVKGLPELAGGYDNKRRFKEIGERLAAMRKQGTAPQIVLIQEAFVDRTAQINEIAKYPYMFKGPNSKDKGVAGGSHLKLYGSGIVILSEFPFDRTGKVAFGSKTCATWDCYANKGIQFADVKVDGLPFALSVFNTHLQAEKDHCDKRIEQMKIVKTFVQKSTGYARPFIFGGDFNISPGQKSYDWWTNESRLESVGEACKNGKYGCQVEDGTDPLTLENVDQQYLFSGVAPSMFDSARTYHVDIKPLRMAKTFREIVRGKQLSDHLGLEASYEITWAPVEQPVP